MNEEILKKLHANLTSRVSGFSVPYEQFVADMQDVEKRQRLHANMPQFFPGFARSFEEFSADLGFITTAQQPSPVPIEVQDQARRDALGAINPILAVPGVADVGVTLGKGVVEAYQGAKGALGIPTMGLAPRILDIAEEAVFGGTSQDLSQQLQEQKSQALQTAEAGAHAGEGFFGTIESYLANPAAIGSEILEVLPAMYGGAGAARVALGLSLKAGGKLGAFAASKLGRAVATGFGEGLVTAGQMAEDLRTKNPDQLLTAKQAGLSLASGILTGTLGAFGNRVAQRLGLDDLDALFVLGKTNPDKALSRLVSIFGGALVEGSIEELPQSLQEQALQNLAEGKDWREGIAEAAASGWLLGSVMGGVANIGGKPTQPDPVQNVTSTGDPALDAELDNLVLPISELINKELAKIDELGLQLKNMAIDDQIAQMEKEHKQTQADLRAAELALFRKQKLEEFQAAQVVPLSQLAGSPGPGIAAAEEEALLTDTSAEGLVPKFEVTDTTVPKYDPQTLDEVGTQPAQAFNYTDGLGGRASGKIVGDMAVIDEIYAGEPGTNLYGKVIAEVQKRGVTRIRVGMQSAASQGALQKLVKNQALTVDKDGGTDAFGNPIDFIIGKPKEEPKVKPTKTKKDAVQEPSTKSVDVRQPAPPRQKVAKALPEEPAVAQKKKAEKLAKALEKQRERDEALRTKLTKQIEVAKHGKYRAARKLARLDELATKADELGFNDVAKAAQEAYDAELARQEEKGEVREKKVVKRLTQEERKAKREAAKAEKKEKAAQKTINKQVTVAANPTLGKAFAKDITGTVGKIRDLFYTSIARAVREERGQAAVNARIDAYIQFRKDNNLKEISREEILKKATAGEQYKKQATKQAIEEATQRRNDRAAAIKYGILTPEGKPDVAAYRAIKDDLKAAEARGMTLAEYQKERDEPTEKDLKKAEQERLQLLDDFQKLITGELGIDDTFDEPQFSSSSVDFIIEATVFQLIKEFNAHLVRKFDLRNDPQALKTLMYNFSQADNRVAAAFLQKIVKENNKRGRTTILAFYPKYRGAWGFYSHGKTTDLIVLGGNPWSTSRGRSVAVHEFTHAYAAILANTEYKNNKSFAKDINNLYDTAKRTLITTLLDLSQKYNGRTDRSQSFLSFAQESNPRTGELIQRIVDYIADFHGYNKTEVARRLEDKLNAVDLDDQVIPPSTQLNDNLFESNFIYGFKDQAEFLAEGMSKQTFADILGLIKVADTKRKSTKQSRSVLFQLLDTITQLLKDTFRNLGWQSAWDDFVFILKEYEYEYENNATLKQIEDNIDYVTSTDYDILLDNWLAEFVGDRGGQLTEFQQQITRAVRQEEYKTRKPWYEQFLGAKKEESENAKILKKTTKVIVDGLVNVLEPAKHIKSEADVLRIIQKANQKLPKNRQIGNAYAAKIWKKIDENRQTLAIHKQIQSTIVNRLRAGQEYKQNPKYARDVENFAQVNLERLPAKDRAVVVDKGLLPLAANTYGDKGYRHAYKIVMNAIVADRIQATLKHKDKINSGRLTQIMSKFTNPMTMVTQLSKFNTEIADSLTKEIYSGLLWATAQSGRVAEQFYEQLTVLAAKNKLQHNDLVTIQLYGSIFSTVNDPNDTVKWEAEVLSNAKKALKSTTHAIQAVEDDTYKGRFTKKELMNERKIAKQILKELKKGVDMKKILNTRQRAVYNAIREFADKYERDFFRNLNGVWDLTAPPRRFNYFPTFAQGNVAVSTKDEHTALYESDVLRGGKHDSIFDALAETHKKGKKTEKYEIYGRKVWSSFRRHQPKGYYYDNDALSVAKKWSQRMLFDVYASSELRMANKFFRNDAIKKMLKPKLHELLVAQIRKMAGAGQTYDPMIGKTARELMKYSDYVYTAQLATSGQLLLQSSSGIAAAMVIASNINPIKATKTFTKAVNAAAMSMRGVNKFSEMLEKEGLGIQLRNVQFERFLSAESFRKALAVNKLKTTGENLTTLALRKSDEFAARLVWFAAYFDAGGTIDKVNPGAVIRAERMVGVLQNMSDTRWAAPFFKRQSMAGKILVMTLYAFKQFALNAWFAMVSSMRNINNKEGRMIAGAVFGTYLSYHVVQTYLLGPLYDKIAHALWGDDDEEEEKRVAKHEELMWNVAWDLGLGSPAPALFDQTARWTIGQALIKHKYKPDFEDFDKFKDSPLYYPERLADVSHVLAGPVYKDLASAVHQTLEYAVLSPHEDEFVEDPQKWDFKRDQMMQQWGVTATGAAFWFPFRGDIMRAIKLKMRQEATNRRKYEELMRGGKSGTKSVGEEYQEIYTDDWLEDPSALDEIQENDY